MICTRWVSSGLLLSALHLATVGCAGVNAASATPSPTPAPTQPTPVAPSSQGNLFAPYVYMGIPQDDDLVQIQQAAGFSSVTLAFLISTGGCTAGWGGLTGSLPSDLLPNGQSIQSLVQTLQTSGVQVIISFGGAAGSEPALTCGSAAALQALYQSVLTRYKVTMLDFDIEGSALTNQASLTLRDQALVGLKAANPGLVISYTIAVLPTGLPASGVNVMATAKADGLNLDVVNIMTMDYGSSNDNGAQMGLDATDAAQNTEAQILANGWTAHVGITPMIGQNDTSTEVFQLKDATTVLQYAQANSFVQRIAMWSVGRDNGSCPGQTTASGTCSGIAQSNYQFTSIFKAY